MCTYIRQRLSLRLMTADRSTQRSEGVQHDEKTVISALDKNKVMSLQEDSTP